MTDKTKGLGPTDECRALLQRVLDTRQAEAKALHAPNVAEENYTFADAECNAYAKAAGEAIYAEKEARAFLTRSAPVAETPNLFTTAARPSDAGFRRELFEKMMLSVGGSISRSGMSPEDYAAAETDVAWRWWNRAILATSKPQDAGSAESAVQFDHNAAKKLESLKADGHQVVGQMLAKDGKYCAISFHGLVLWPRTQDQANADEWQVAELRAAAQAVIDRWDSPLWKDLPHTAEFINRLRATIPQAGQES